MIKNIFTTTIFCLLFIISRAQIAENPEDISPLLIGEKLPNEEIVTIKNESIKLFSIIKDIPTVLVFYRGGWCPYCNSHLSAFAEIEAEILQLGYQIIAISPEDYRNLEPTISKDEIKYQVFADPNGNLIQKIGIAYKTPKIAKVFVATKTIGDVSEILPVPTVMIINTKGEILFEYINPDYKKRLASSLLLAILKNLEK